MTSKNETDEQIEIFYQMRRKLTVIYLMQQQWIGKVQLERHVSMHSNLHMGTQTQNAQVPEEEDRNRESIAINEEIRLKITTGARYIV